MNETDQAHIAYSAGEPLMLPPAEIINSPHNPRKKKGLDIASLTDLAASIRAKGVLQPIVVRPLPSDRVEETADLSPRPGYEIIAGERRWRAAQIAELTAMPVLLRRELNEEEVDELRLVENIQREDLDPLEEAEGFEQLRVRHGYSVKQIAAKITDGKGESYVYKRMALNKLTQAVRDAMYEADALDVSLAQLVAKYEPGTQEDVLDYLRGMKARAEDRWPTFRVAQDALAKAFHLVLAQAPFDIAAEDLVAAAGSCTACSKRTGNQGDMFGGASTEPDSCTDTGCFQRKREAHVIVLRKRLSDEGFKVIDAADADRALQGMPPGAIKGFERLDKVAYTERGNDGREREVTFGDALRAMGKKAPKPRVFIDPHSLEPMKVITSELAEKLVPQKAEAPEPAKKLAAKGKQASGKAPGQPSPSGTDKEIALDVPDVRRAVVHRIFDAIRTGTRTEQEARLVARALLLDQEGAELTFAYLGFPQITQAKPEETEAWMDAQPVEEIGKLLAMAAVELSFGEFAGSTMHAARRVLLATSYGVDVLAVRDKVADDLANAEPSGERGGPLHPAQLERLIDKAIEAWKAAEASKGKKKAPLWKVNALRAEMDTLRDAQADLRAGNTEEAMTALHELAGVGEFEGDGTAQVVGAELRELLLPVQD